jgi:hypothetical protein
MLEEENEQQLQELFQLRNRAQQNGAMQRDKTPPENDDDTMKPKSENDDGWHCEFKHTERARER